MISRPSIDAPLTVLIVDDEEVLVRSCSRILEQECYEVVSASRAREALAVVERRRPDIVLTDLRLPDMDGVALLREIKAKLPQTLVILVTGYATVDSSIEAIQAGAYDYIPKPFTATQLQVLVGRAASQVRLVRDNERLRGELRGRNGIDNIIGRSATMRQVFELVDKVAPTEASVFIRGESGTGKELIARAIHQHSPRAGRAFVAVNCAAFPQNLLESELFGHEKGAFTSADAPKRGLVETASGGTFFLDEICEMSLELQAKLLRMLQERRIRRLGAETEIPVDIRIVAATNVNPEAAVADGRLRQDLFFRLNVVPIRVPALRERREDIPVLAHHFLRQYAALYGRNGAAPLRLSADAVHALLARDWPGNVRELQNAMERAVSLASPGQEVGPAELREDTGRPEGEPYVGPVTADRPFREAKEDAIEAFERAYVEALLARTNGNISSAARDAGVDRKTIHRLLQKHGLSARAAAGV